MFADPERLEEIETAVGKAADTLAELDDSGGDAKARTVPPGCPARLGRIGDSGVAVSKARTAWLSMRTPPRQPHSWVELVLRSTGTPEPTNYVRRASVSRATR